MDRLHNARQMIGRARDEPVTPALILDLRAVERNIAEMARRMAGLPAALRPHAKIHKSPIVGQMQLDAGAIGLTTATVWEASALIDAGLTDVLVANQAVGPVKAARAGADRRSRPRDRRGRERRQCARAVGGGGRRGSQIDVMVEVDVGQHRSGVRSVEAALELAGVIGRLPGVRLQGLLGYEGHCMLEPDRALRIEKATPPTTS